ncbi:MAG: tetratricopeptide repeat protein [Treponema sp.]|nr:tetratricopeptide repeat protein [Candidatus Treponema caballi]
MKKKDCFRKVLLCAVCVLAISAVHADSYADAVELFRTNKPQEAIPLFQDALSKGTASPDIYNYLGLAYYQTGQMQKSFETYQIGLLMPDTDKRTLYYNAGNVAFALGYYDRADELYTYALTKDSHFAAATLNRANARMKSLQYEWAVDDYKTYLELAPETEQRGNIEKLIALLTQQMEDGTLSNQNVTQRQMGAIVQQQIEESLAQQQAEQAAVQAAQQAAWEQQRAEEEAQRVAAEAQAAEQKKQEEAARRQRLLQAAAAALQNSAAQTNSSAGAEEVKDYVHDEELD